MTDRSPLDVAREALEEVEPMLTDAQADAESDPGHEPDVIEHFKVVRSKVRSALAALASCKAAGGATAQESIQRLKMRIDDRLNAYLCDMKPDYDDSIVGFNEAWDIVRKVFEIVASEREAITEPAGDEVEAAKLAEYFLSLREDEMPLSNPDLWANVTKAERDIIVAALLASKARTGETESKER